MPASFASVASSKGSVPPMLMFPAKFTWGAVRKLVVPPRLPAGGIPVALRCPPRQVQRARVLYGVASMLDGEHVANAAVAVARLGTQTRGIGRGRLFDLLGGNVSDGAPVGCVLGAALLEMLPYRTHGMRRAVGKRDFVGAFKGGVYLRREPIGLGESRLVGHPTLGHTREQVLLLGLLATQADNAHGPVDNAGLHVLKAGASTPSPGWAPCHGELVPAALEVVVGEDGAAHNGQVRVGAHKVVGQKG